MDRRARTGVIVVTAVRLYGESLRMSLEEAADLDVVGVEGDLEGAEARIEALRPDIVLLDPDLPEAEDLARSVFRRGDDIKVVMLGLARAEEEAVHWARCGADGFVTRENSLDELIGVIRSVAEGRFRCSPGVASALMAELARQSQGQPPTQLSPHLTRREQEVGGLLARGMSNKQIARSLGIAVSTVKNHVHNILSKLDLQRRGQVARWLNRQGLRPSRSGRGDRTRESADRAG